MRTKTLAAGAAIALTLPALATAQEPLEGAEAVNLQEWSYDEIYQNGWSTDAMFDAEVYGADGEEIGDVENIIVGPDGKILSIIAQVGGFWDIGDTHVNVPWDQVEVGDNLETIVIPVNEDNIGEYSVFNDYLTADAAASEAMPVDDDLEAGPRAWRVTELTGDYVRLEGDVDYGYVSDLLFTMDGSLNAVVVQPDVGYGVGAGYYAYPYYGYDYGWTPGYEYYDLPYTEEQIGGLEPYDYGAMSGEG